MKTITATAAQTEASRKDGQGDGELAAITNLSARRALARTEMATDHDPAYAAAYWNAYVATVELLAKTRKVGQR